MKKEKLALLAAGFLVLLTFIGHTVGAIGRKSYNQPEAQQIYELMSQTKVIMPIGEAKSFAQILFGANLCLSAYLLATGFCFILLSRTEPSRLKAQVVLINSVSAAAISICSFLYFFPIPALFTGLAAVLGLISSRFSTVRS